MKRFFVTHSVLVSSPIFFSFSDAMDLVEATNKRFAIWNDYENLILIVEADNPPQNSPTHNIFWREIVKGGIDENYSYHY